MRRQRRGIQFLALLLGFSLLATAAACGDDDDEDAGTEDTGGDGEGPTGGTLRDLQNLAQGDPDHIDPQLTATFQGAQIPQLVFDTLLEYDYSGEEPELVGQVAETWESDDGMTWTFTLKEDQVFSDGSPVTPSAFKRGWERATSPELASEVSYHLLPIQGAQEMLDGAATELTGVVADDEANTLTVTLTEPFFDFPGVVTHPVFSPVPESATGSDWEQGVMIGNGPFMMDGPWERGVAINLVRNEEWNGGIYGEGTQAKLDGIEFVISADVESAYSDFEGGNGDTALIPPGRFDEATSNYPNATDDNLGAYFFGVNMESQLGGEENLKLRQAISLAIDRAAINDTVYDGARNLANQLTPEGVVGYEDGLCEFCETDQDEAQRLYDEWVEEGGQLSAPIRLNFNVDSGHEDVVAIVEQNLEDLGLEVEQDGRNPDTYFSEMRRGDCELCRLGWIWDYPLYDNPIFAELHSSSIDGDNIARYNNPEVDELINNARTTENEEERLGLYRDAEARALEDLPLIPANWYTGQVVYTESVDNVIMTPIQFILYEQVTKEE